MASKKTSQYRTESDSMGEMQVPADALYKAQTARAVANFPVSGKVMPSEFIAAVVQIKKAAALTNCDLGLLSKARCQGIVKACDRLLAGDFEGELGDAFPVDVFQTGSGTSTNMNANEVIATLANADTSREGAQGESVHPNDHVNMSQSSNDTIPSALYASCALQVQTSLLPALHHLVGGIDAKAEQLRDVIKTGRTHLMDAMPIRFGDEVAAWKVPLRASIDRLHSLMPRLTSIAQGGTAVGSGINAHPEFAGRFAKYLSDQLELPIQSGESFFEGLSSLDVPLELSGILRSTTTQLLKISNDLRWMNAGPLAGLGEIELTALQPGSSIMPGKVNPVIPESVAMVAAYVAGCDATVQVGAQQGNFQLNVMLPVVAYSLLEALRVTASSARLLGDKAIAGFAVRQDNIDHALSRNPILVTALNSLVGYEKAAAIAKQAYAENRPVVDVAEECTDIPRDRLVQLLDPAKLADGGIPE